MTDPKIAEAEAALQQLSQDPIAREYAYRRQLELVHYQRSLEAERREGRKEGLHRGALRAVETLCNAFGVELTAERRQRLDAMSADELGAFHAQIAESRAWPER